MTIMYLQFSIEFYPRDSLEPSVAIDLLLQFSIEFYRALNVSEGGGFQYSTLQFSIEFYFTWASTFPEERGYLAVLY